MQPRRGGTDWRRIRILEVDSGTTLEHDIKWAHFTGISWAKDSSGFFYSRNAKPEKDAEYLAPILGHAVYFHRLGTEQSEDRLVYAPESDFPLIHTADVTADGRYAVIYSAAHTGGNGFSVVDLSNPDWPIRTVVDTFDHTWLLDVRELVNPAEELKRGINLQSVQDGINTETAYGYLLELSDEMPAEPALDNVSFTPEYRGGWIHRALAGSMLRLRVDEEAREVAAIVSFHTPSAPESLGMAGCFARSVSGSSAVPSA